LPQRAGCDSVVRVVAREVIQMGLLQRLFKREEEPVEILCQRCGVPAPPASVECAACGWDLRESYHGEVGAGAGR
jgi:hypothetical protein